MDNWFVTAARIQRDYGRISPEFYRKLRDAEDRSLEEPEEKDYEERWHSCNCGERCRC